MTGVDRETARDVASTERGLAERTRERRERGEKGDRFASPMVSPD